VRRSAPLGTSVHSPSLVPQFFRAPVLAVASRTGNGDVHALLHSLGTAPREMGQGRRAPDSVASPRAAPPDPPSGVRLLRRVPQKVRQHHSLEGALLLAAFALCAPCDRSPKGLQGGLCLAPLTHFHPQSRRCTAACCWQLGAAWGLFCWGLEGSLCLALLTPLSPPRSMMSHPLVP
jgi:hypothetical protein